MNYNEVFNIDSRAECICLDGKTRKVVGSTEAFKIILNTKEMDSQIICDPEELMYENSKFKQVEV